MTTEATGTFKLNEVYYEFGQNNAKAGFFDLSYANRTDDRTLSYLAGWASVPVEKRYNGDRPVIACI